MSEGKKQQASTTAGPSVRQYTVPSKHRPGKRCAAAKRELGDDLLTVVALVPGSPFGFKRRKLMRKYLSGPAHKLRSREFYRKVLTLPVPKIQPLFEFYIARNAKLQEYFKGINHTNYTTYKWGWFSKMLDKPMLDPRALCIEVIFAVNDQINSHALSLSPRWHAKAINFENPAPAYDTHVVVVVVQVGMTLAPWAPGEADKIAQLSREAEMYNDIIIGPYLDGRLVRKLAILFTPSL